MTRVRKAEARDIDSICVLGLCEYIEEGGLMSGSDWSYASTRCQSEERIVHDRIKGETFVLEDPVAGQVVGFFSGHYYPAPFDLSRDILHEIGWYVLPLYRGKGYGFKLLEAAEQAAREHKGSAMTLGVAVMHPNHEKLLAKYQTLGFRPWQILSFKVLTGDNAK